MTSFNTYSGHEVIIFEYASENAIFLSAFIFETFHFYRRRWLDEFILILSIEFYEHTILTWKFYWVNNTCHQNIYSESWSNPNRPAEIFAFCVDRFLFLFLYHERCDIRLLLPFCVLMRSKTKKLLNLWVIRSCMTTSIQFHSRIYICCWPYRYEVKWIEKRVQTENQHFKGGEFHELLFAYQSSCVKLMNNGSSMTIRNWLIVRSEWNVQNYHITSPGLVFNRLSRCDCISLNWLWERDCLARDSLIKRFGLAFDSHFPYERISSQSQNLSHTITSPAHMYVKEKLISAK